MGGKVENKVKTVGDNSRTVEDTGRTVEDKVAQ